MKYFQNEARKQKSIEEVTLQFSMIFQIKLKNNNVNFQVMPFKQPLSQCLQYSTYTDSAFINSIPIRYISNEQRNFLNLLSLYGLVLRFNVFTNLKML
jgi:hypothetical protein